MFGRLRCREALTELSALWCLPHAREGQGLQHQAPGKSLVHGSMWVFGGAGRRGLQLARISELRLCGLDALLRQVIVQLLKYNVPIKPCLSYGPGPRVPCFALHPVPRRRVLWF